jgi:hypothetical protein
MSAAAAKASAFDPNGGVPIAVMHLMSLSNRRLFSFI